MVGVHCNANSNIQYPNVYEVLELYIIRNIEEFKKTHAEMLGK